MSENTGQRGISLDDTDHPLHQLNRTLNRNAASEPNDVITTSDLPDLDQSPTVRPHDIRNGRHRASQSVPHQSQFDLTRSRQPTFPVHNPYRPHFVHRDGAIRSNTSTVQTERLDRINSLAQRLQERIPKPARVDGRPPKLQDAIRYFLRVTWIRRLIAALNGVMSGVQLCDACAQLQLTSEDFLVSSKASSRPITTRGVFSPGSSTGKHIIGDLFMIASKAHWCSLCRLIVTSLREQPRFNWLSPDTVSTNSGPLGFETELHGTKCYLSWQIDGRTLNTNTADRKRKYPFLEQGAYTARTRRIKVEWDGILNANADAIESFYLVLLADVARQPWTDFLGQHVATRQSSTALIKSWLDRCSRDHRGTSCDVGSSTDADKILKQAYFGVIDLQDMRLTSLPENQRYVALSYTWGRIEFYQTKKSNVRSLQAPGGIERILGLLPQTMRDAMSLARDLGERYFWADALCIVQDSEATWQLNANVMNQIYNNAYFTICAADGANAKAGLVSYRDWQRSRSGQMHRLGSDELRPSFSQKIEYYSRGVQLMASYSAESYINKSVWNERAWTFQERLLSRRCVLFVAGRVFFQCRSTVLREDILAQTPDGRSVEHRGTPLELLGDIRKRPLSVYIQCVELYTRRQLTKSRDILNAFKGVGNYIGEVLGSEGLLYGLPRSHFDWALLWQLKGGPQTHPGFRGRQDVDNGPIDDYPHTFPTWSWCGWTGAQAHYNAHMIDGTMANVSDWLANHTWIVWYVRDGHGNLKLVQDSRRPRPESAAGLASKWSGYNHSTNVGRTHDAYGRTLDGELRRGQPEQFSFTLDEFPFQVSVSQSQLDEDNLEVTNKDELNLADMRFLQFFSLSASFSLKHFEQFPDENMSMGFAPPQEHECRWAIVDYKGDIWGVVTPDREAWRRGRDQIVDLSTGTHRFIAISEAKEFSREEVAGWDDYVPHETEGTEWDIFYVLLVKEVDSVCYRLGLGKVRKEAFWHSCDGEAEWREFILG